MITIDYLRGLLAAGNGGLSAVTQPATQVIDSPDIMEGLTELAQHKGLPFAVRGSDGNACEDGVL